MDAEIAEGDDRAVGAAEQRQILAEQANLAWRGADGRYRWLLWAINPVPEEKLLYAVAHDITDRREDEENGGEPEQRLQSAACAS